MSLARESEAAAPHENDLIVPEENVPDENNSGEQEQKRAHRSRRNEYHCLEDVCILIRLPSSSTNVSAQVAHQDSDESLNAYISQALTRTAQQLEPSADGSDNTDNKLFEFGEEQENQDQLDLDESTGSNEEFFCAADCSEFMDTVTFAKEFVNNVVSESEATAEAALTPSLEKKDDMPENTSDDFMGGFRDGWMDDFAYIETKRSFSGWPTIGSFTIETGAYKIDEYLASFETEEDWMYVIYFQGVQETPCSNMYKYQAIFSLPSWRYPIAQATASIYFTIEVCKVKPRNCLVNVTYKYEAFGHERKPGLFDFEEKRLHYILDAKIRLFKTVTY